MDNAVYSVEFSPLVPTSMAVILFIVATLLCLPLLIQKIKGGWIRYSLFLVMALILLNPVLQKEKREKQNDVALILVDQSPSQKIGERPDVIAETLAELTAQLDQKAGLDYRIIRTDGHLATQDGTHLLPEIIRSQASTSAQRLAGTFILSDGQVHDPSLTENNEANIVSSLHSGSPIHLILTGGNNERDRRLAIQDAPRFSIIGEKAPITLSIEDTGNIKDDGTVKVNVIVDGKPYGTYGVQVGEPLTIDPKIEHGGQTIVELSTPVLEGGELTVQNNRTIVAINGIRQQLKVLLITGEPHMGERTWRNLLKSDPSVELVHFTILRPPEKQDGTPSMELALIAFPTRELFVEKLDDFDLIVFDRYKLRGVLPLNYFQNIAEYVQDGGALFVAAGPAYSSSLSIYRTPLGRILPARPSGTILAKAFRPTMTDDGVIHPVTTTLSDTKPGSWGRWFRMIETEPLNGNILLDGPDGTPLLVISHVGEGRVAQLNSDQAWLWTRGFEGGGPHTELLRRTAHWLMKEPELEEEALFIEIENGHLRTTLTTMAKKPADVVVIAPDGQTKTLSLSPKVQNQPGKWSASMKADQTGIYRAAVGPLIAVTSNGTTNPVEFTDMLPTDRYFAPLIKATGGGSFTAQANGSIRLPALRQFSGQTNQFAGLNWAGLKRNNAYRVTGYTQGSLTPAFLALVILIGGLLFGWYRESR